MLSLILPTYNEAENLSDLLEEIDHVLKTVPYEVIVVDDDSPDRTWEVAQLLAEERPYLRVLRRRGRRGLASAVVEGFAMAGGDVLVVMDADRQHDSSLLPQLYAAIQNGADIAVASRYTEGGGTGVWMRARTFESALATRCVRFVCGVSVRDPLSGFFALKREHFRRVASSLRPRGFKILLEVLSQLPRGMRVEEFPYHFRIRTAGESKLTMCVRMQFLIQICFLALRRAQNVLGTFQKSLFLLVCAIVFLSLAPPAWALRLLYTDPSVRDATQKMLVTLAEREGWLLSDVLLQEVSRDRIRFLHRRHARGHDLSHCYELISSAMSLLSCDEA